MKNLKTSNNLFRNLQDDFFLFAFIANEEKNKQTKTYIIQ